MKTCQAFLVVFSVTSRFTFEEALSIYHVRFYIHNYGYLTSYGYVAVLLSLQRHLRSTSRALRKQVRQ